MILEPQAKLTLDELESLASSKKGLELSKRARQKLDEGSKIVRKLAQSKRPIYGVNTGFGRLAQIKISEKDLVALQINLLRSHACGIGAATSASVVRRLLLLRAFSLGKGASGISSALVERHLEYLEKNLIPFIPEQGSVGASGDLAPLAHLGLTFMGEGEFWCDGKNFSAAEVLKKYKMQAISIGPKEGLALVNGTQFSLALAMEVRTQLRDLLPWMELAAALSIEAHQATAAVFDPRLHKLKAHSQQQAVAARFVKMLANSKHMNSHKDCDAVQDSYSFRCIPQVLGPAYSLIEKAEELLTDEANSVSDNPILICETKELLSGGHFHAQSVSFAADLMSIAMTTIGNLTERRIDQLMNPLTTRLSAFLATKPGVESGMMILQTAAAALASENKTLAHPASVDTIPTNGNQEDHVSMAPWASRKALMILSNLRRIVAAEVVAGVRGCVLESTKSGISYSTFVEKSLSMFSENIPELFLAGDREFSKDWQKVEKFIGDSKSPRV
ncbi:MAG: histidine ammonia-lyase [Deltaproteobacteria bacterium]|nr:histidine ammonia-lyase [Deltaproteobacteria bacterium]